MVCFHNSVDENSLSKDNKFAITLENTWMTTGGVPIASLKGSSQIEKGKTRLRYSSEA